MLISADALANIEQYAIDLAWDIIARFADVEVDGERLPIEFFLDWAKVAEDEAKHFTLLSKRLNVSRDLHLAWPRADQPGAGIALWRAQRYVSWSSLPFGQADII